MLGLSWLLSAALAAGTTSYIESDARSDRAAIDALATRAAELGCPGEVIRHFVAGTGWSYAFRSADGIEEAALASCWTVLSSEQTVSVELLQRLDAELPSLESAPAEPAPVAAPPDLDTDAGLEDEPMSEEAAVEASLSPAHAVLPDPVDPPTAEPAIVSAVVDEPDMPLLAKASGHVHAATPLTVEGVLARLVRAHHGPSATTSGWAGDILFRFRRRTDDGRVVDHIYARRGADLYLQVDVIGGPGQSSRAGLVGGKAWMHGAEGETFDPELVRATIERFSPEHVLQRAATLAAGKPDVEDPTAFHVVDSGDRKAPRVWIEGPGRAEGSRVRIAVDRTTWRLSEVERHELGGESVQIYDGWLELDDGTLRPSSIVTRIGERVVDTIEAVEITRAPTFLAEWFAPDTQED